MINLHLLAPPVFYYCISIRTKRPLASTKWDGWWHSRSCEANRHDWRLSRRLGLQLVSSRQPTCIQAQPSRFTNPRLLLLRKQQRTTTRMGSSRWRSSLLLLGVGLSLSNAKHLRNIFPLQQTTNEVATSLLSSHQRRRTQDEGSFLPPLEEVRTANGFPSFHLLTKCQGDCDRNSDCEGDLLCFQRGGATTIPGCAGLAPLDGTDYCWDPRDKPPSGRVARVGNNGHPSVLFPLGRCHGNCVDDTECARDLVCWERSRHIQYVPGCQGQPGPTDSSNYCVEPLDLPDSLREQTPHHTVAVAQATAEVLPVEMVVVDPNPVAPLGLCEADCDSDEQCLGDLICLQREKSEDVPGCAGIPRDYFDYCIHPSSLITGNSNAMDDSDNPPVTTGNVEEPTTTIGVCQGGCQVDGDCKDSLLCFHRRFGPVPGCPGNTEDLTNYCIPPIHFTGALHVSDQSVDMSDQKMGASISLTGGMLELCEGTCVTDSSCAGNLVCVQKNRRGTTPQCGAVPFAAYCAPKQSETSNALADVGNDWNAPNRFPLQLCEGKKKNAVHGKQPLTLTLCSRQAIATVTSIVLVSWYAINETPATWSPPALVAQHDHPTTVFMQVTSSLILQNPTVFV